MLTYLHIENIAVIQKTGIDFDTGFNVLTGETGAGKSILIDAIHVILGSRASKDLIRQGENSAHVSALFTDLSEQIKIFTTELGYPCDEDGNLLIQREVSLHAKGSVRINGRPCTISILKEIGEQLINIHGQHENQALLSVEKHLTYLDYSGGLVLSLAEYKRLYKELRELSTQLKELQINETEKERKLDLLRYQIQEIQEAELQIGEWESLKEKRNLFINSEKIAEKIKIADTSLNGEENYFGAIQMISSAVDALQKVSSYSAILEQASEKLSDIYYEVQECSSIIENYISTLEYDPFEQEQIEDRLEIIERLKRKYGNTVEEILSFLKDAEKELENIEFSEEKCKHLEIQYEQKYAQAFEAAKELSLNRKKAGEELSSKIKNELRYLDMNQVNFHIEYEETPLTSTGIDSVEFMISTNPGEKPKSIAKIASGGELSRIMLAIKNILAENDDIDTLIFDEVDTGISGRAAQKVGQKLKEISKNRQVICVTHLAQIAAYADEHFLIEKSVENERTYTQVKKLDHEQRKYELARIMNGTDVTPIMLNNAEELLRISLKD